jgi:flagellar FliL protein
MADEENTNAAAPEEKKKRSPIIMIAALVLVGLVLAGGISYFVTTKLMTNTSTSGESKHHDPGVFIKLGDAKEGIIVNVGGIKASRFLKVGIVMEMNPGKKDNITDNKLNPLAETKILDTTLQILRTVKIDELDAAKQDELKQKIKVDVNKALGEGSVYDVYITSFVLQ